MRNINNIAFFPAIAFMLPSAHAATFSGLQPFPELNSSVRFASADGQTIYGDSGVPFGDRTRAWRYRGSFEELTATMASPLVLISGGSADGQVVVGQRFTVFGGEVTTIASRWQDGSIIDLGFLPTGRNSTAHGASGDGSVVVGFSSVVRTVDLFANRAFRWTATAGMTELQPVAGDPQSVAYAISRDASTVVGISGDNRPQLGTRPFEAVRWTNDGVAHEIGNLRDGSHAIPFAVNIDGSVIVGQDTLLAPNNGSIRRAFRWDIVNGMRDLGLAEGHTSSLALGVSGDGTFIVGSGAHFFDGQSSATLWSEELGLVDLNVYLPTLGIDLTGWRLSSAQFISDDGRTIVGQGSFQIGPLPSDRIGLAWVATIPNPTTATLLVLSLFALRRSRQPKSAMGRLDTGRDERRAWVDKCGVRA